MSNHRKRVHYTGEEKVAILRAHYEHPLEGYRRLTWMMMDANVVACSPGTVYNVLRQADVLRPRGKESRKGKGFVQPLLLPFAQSQPTHSAKPVDGLKR